ncbi:unnamed protein product, partial [Prorocentrum cordatum]
KCEFNRDAQGGGFRFSPRPRASRGRREAMRRRSTPRRAAAFAALAAALPGLAGLLPGRPTWPTFALGAPALFGAGARTAAERARRRALSQEDLEAVKAGAGEGDAEALYTYGVLLLQGDGVPQDGRRWQCSTSG